MRAIAFTLILLLPISWADEVSHDEKLSSESFAERQKAAKGLIEWAREEDSEERAEELYQRYLNSEDPEEFHRLSKVLLEVHFEHKKDTIPQQGPGFIGISMDAAQIRRGQLLEQQGAAQPVPDFGRGVFVRAVIPGTPAEKSGLQVGDVIVSIDNESIADGIPSDKLKDIVGAMPPGSTITLGVERGEEELEIKVTLMNGKAIPALRAFNEEAVVDQEKAEQLLREDYLRWLASQRIAKRKIEQQ